jgi:subtilisin-like proprotein convertase family protein
VPPSNNVHAYYRLPVRGLGITTTSGMGGLSTNQFGGTSSATPLVAGIIGLVISANPELTALEVVSILKQTASKDLNFEGYARTPSASYDRNPTWDVSPIAPFDQGEFQASNDPDGTWSPWFGHGKVDAFAAVTAAQAHLPDKEPEPEGSQILTYQSAPAIAIPDNNSQGILDRLVVTEAGILKDLAVSVSIIHPWIGDLRVQLVAPDGTTVIFHDRTGSSQDNLQVTYTPQDFPGLATLKNKSIQGEWQLQVRDLAVRDVGRLASWSLSLTTGTGSFEVEDTEAVEIPDFNTQGVVRSQTLPDGLVIKHIEVFADVTHPNIGDLRISLITPQGMPVTLHNQTGGGLDTLSRTWNDQDTLSLQALRGKAAVGTWQLRVADLNSYHTGKLNRWRLAVQG